MLAMTALGFGEVFGCFFIGMIIDKYGSKKSTLVILVLIVFTFLSTFAYIKVWEFGVLAYVMCFFWGFSDSAVNTHCNEILGFEFDDNITPFSVMNAC